MVMTRRGLLGGAVAVALAALGVRGAIAVTPSVRRNLVAARVNARAANGALALTDNDPFVWALVYAAHHALEDIEPVAASAFVGGTYDKYILVRDELRALTAPLPGAFDSLPIYGTSLAPVVRSTCRRVVAFVNLAL
jgi:hypothetical protein